MTTPIPPGVGEDFADALIMLRATITSHTDLDVEVATQILMQRADAGTLADLVTGCAGMAAVLFHLLQLRVQLPDDEIVGMLGQALAESRE